LWGFHITAVKNEIEWKEHKLRITFEMVEKFILGLWMLRRNLLNLKDICPEDGGSCFLWHFAYLPRLHDVITQNITIYSSNAGGSSFTW
jgi:hypothetical protein